MTRGRDDSDKYINLFYNSNYIEAEVTYWQKLRDKLFIYFWLFNGDKLSSFTELELWFAQNLLTVFTFSRNLLTPYEVREKHLEISIAVRNLHDLESSKTTSSSILVELRFNS